MIQKGKHEIIEEGPIIDQTPMIKAITNLQSERQRLEIIGTPYQAMLENRQTVLRTKSTTILIVNISMQMELAIQSMAIQLLRLK